MPHKTRVSQAIDLVLRSGPPSPPPNCGFIRSRSGMQQFCTCGFGRGRRVKQGPYRHARLGAFMAESLLASSREACC